MTAPKYTICTAVVGNDGTFRCKGYTPRCQVGAPGPHKVNAKYPHVHGLHRFHGIHADLIVLGASVPRRRRTSRRL